MHEIQPLTDQTRASPTWHVFLAEAERFVGTVELPAGFRPTAIYADAILGVQRDELDVESIREYKVIR